MCLLFPDNNSCFLFFDTILPNYERSCYLKSWSQFEFELSRDKRIKSSPSLFHILWKFYSNFWWHENSIHIFVVNEIDIHKLKFYFFQRANYSWFRQMINSQNTIFIVLFMYDCRNSFTVVNCKECHLITSFVCNIGCVYVIDKARHAKIR